MLNCVAKLNLNVHRKGCRSRYIEALKILQFLQPLVSIKCSIKLEMPCNILRTILQYCIYYYFIALILFYSCKIVTVLKLRVLPCTYKCPHFIFKWIFSNILEHCLLLDLLLCGLTLCSFMCPRQLVNLFSKLLPHFQMFSSMKIGAYQNFAYNEKLDPCLKTSMTLASIYLLGIQTTVIHITSNKFKMFDANWYIFNTLLKRVRPQIYGKDIMPN